MNSNDAELVVTYLNVQSLKIKQTNSMELSHSWEVASCAAT
jgi:hypothetical protein